MPKIEIQEDKFVNCYCSQSLEKSEKDIIANAVNLFNHFRIIDFISWKEKYFIINFHEDDRARVGFDLSDLVNILEFVLDDWKIYEI